MWTEVFESWDFRGNLLFKKTILPLYQRWKNTMKTSTKRQLSKVGRQFDTTLKISKSASPRSSWACSPPTSYHWISRWAASWVSFKNDFSLEKNECVYHWLFPSSIIICSRYFYRFSFLRTFIDSYVYVHMHSWPLDSVRVRSTHPSSQLKVCV